MLLNKSIYAQTAKTIGSISNKYQSDAEMLDRCQSDGLCYLGIFQKIGIGHTIIKVSYNLKAVYFMLDIIYVYMLNTWWGIPNTFNSKTNSAEGVMIC